MIVKLSLHELLIWLYLSQPFEKTWITNHWVTKDRPLISQNCGVRKISLQSADRKFIPKMINQPIGYP